MRFGVVLCCLLVVPVRAAYMSGSCPPAVALRQCAPTCQDHVECPGALLCCDTVCGGTACVRPVTSVRKGQRDQGNGPECCPKPGRCPDVVEGSWMCSTRCRGDFDCDGPTKCCLSRCGAMECAAPVL
ncbi:antileukoproteinase [Thrips palmi]|uniref:Antileukoproteinase n=1 Tax=Thrips palmi TaxID=161013 RepID=A0A6P8ZKP1_THRPL|nr:antileukoproteinase [Thrips palmi]